MTPIIFSSGLFRRITLGAVPLLAFTMSLSLHAAEGDVFHQDASDGHARIISGNQLSETAIRNVRNVVLQGIGPTSRDATDRDLEQLKGASNLERLFIAADGVTAAGLAQLSRLANLQVVEYPRMSSADQKLRTLAAFPALEKLVICKSDVTKDGAESISQMKKLSYLDMSECNIDTSFFEDHPLPQSITHLAIDKTNVDSQVVKFLPRGVTHLSINGAKVNNSIIPGLLQLQKLQVLKIEGLSHEEMRTIEEGLPKTKINESHFSTF